jgi:putative ABC transport system ATP-binding protein
MVEKETPDLVAELSNVVKTYDEGSLKVEALAGIALGIKRGIFSMVVGPSGSGKTTLLNLLGCIDRPTSGSIAICGQPIAALSDRETTQFRAAKIGFIFQSFNLNPVLSAFESIEYPLLLIGVPAAERRDKAFQMLEAVGLADHQNHRPNQLSGGQKQRVAIARALIKGPELVLADEPTANLDSRTGQTIIDLMRRIQKEHGASFIFSTHDPQLISHAEDIVRLRDGRVVDEELAPSP